MTFDSSHGYIHGHIMLNQKAGNYTYTKLHDLVCGDKNYFFAVVKRSEKKNLNSANSRLSLWLTDPSIGFDNAFRADIYGVSTIDLVEQYDVIRMHRATYEGDKLISGSVGRLGFQFLLWSGKPGDSMQPKSTSSNFTHVENDNSVVRNLRIWVDENLEKEKHCGLFKLTDDLCDFSRLGDYLTVVVQVVGVFLTYKNSTVIRVWDGTRISSGRMLKTKAFDLTKIDIASEVTVTYSYEKDLDEKIGDYSVDVFVYDEHIEAARLLKIEKRLLLVKQNAFDFVMLGNIHAYHRRTSSISLTLHGSMKANASIKYRRGIWKMNPDDASVLQLRKKIGDIIGSVRINLTDEEHAKDEAACSNANVQEAQVEVQSIDSRDHIPHRSSSSFLSVIEIVDPSAYEKIQQIAKSVARAKHGTKSPNGEQSPSKKISLHSSHTEYKTESSQLNLTDREKQFLSDYAYLLSNKDALSSSFEEEVYCTPNPLRNQYQQLNVNPSSRENFKTPDDKEESIMYSQDPVVVVKRCSVPGNCRFADREQQTSQPLSENNATDSDDTTIATDIDFSPLASSTQKDYFNVAPRRSLRQTLQ
uniref:Protection of telomeres protein 1 ssDNA-binding domain-containing protein n=1 Tax=Romanomermis culicivorax TaxID=13658 RepID=A0A915K6E0_ROMCU